MAATRRRSMAIGRRAVVLGGLGIALLAACGGEDDEPLKVRDDPRALTAKEAELLALARFRLHRAEVVPVTMEWPGSPSAELTVTLDLHEGAAWGRIATDGDGGERFILWNLQTLGTAPAGAAVPAPEEWSTRGMSTDVPQDIFLALALTLGSDRPENPVLLQQSSAQFLRRDEVDGRSVVVVTGPRPADETEERSSRSRYWIDDDGALLRFEAYLGDSAGRLAQLTVTDPHDEIDGLRESAASVLVAGQR